MAVFQYGKDISQILAAAIGEQLRGEVIDNLVREYLKEVQTMLREKIQEELEHLVFEDVHHLKDMAELCDKIQVSLRWEDKHGPECS